MIKRIRISVLYENQILNTLQVEMNESVNHSACICII